MSIKSVEYLSCSNCLYNLTGKTDKKMQIAQIGRILVFEVTRIWICLNCCKIQDQRVAIVEIQYLRPQTAAAREWWSRGFPARYSFSQKTPSGCPQHSHWSDEGVRRQKVHTSLHRRGLSTQDNENQCIAAWVNEQESQCTTDRCSLFLRDTQSASETPRSAPFCTLIYSQSSSAEVIARRLIGTCA